MVRVTDPNTRLVLADLLRSADPPCKRLFLDYRGLRLLRGWMDTIGWSSQDLDLKVAVEEALDSLAVPHKTMLKESRVLQVVTVWAEADTEEEAKKMMSRPSSTSNSRVSSPPLGPNKESTSKSR